MNHDEEKLKSEATSWNGFHSYLCSSTKSRKGENPQTLLKRNWFLPARLMEKRAELFSFCLLSSVCLSSIYMYIYVYINNTYFIHTYAYLCVYHLSICMYMCVYISNTYTLYICMHMYAYVSTMQMCIHIYIHMHICV